MCSNIRRLVDLRKAGSAWAVWRGQAAASPAPDSDTLALAVAAARHGPGPARLTELARADGLTAFRRTYERLGPPEREQVVRAAAALARQSVYAVLLGTAGYPPQLATARGAPAYLFCRGPADVLRRAGVGVCGGPAATPTALAAATTCGRVTAERGLALVAGDGRGVDAAAHRAALRAGGAAVLVLAEGISRLRPPPRGLADCWDPARVAVVSPFPPGQRRTAATLTARATTVLGLPQTLVVVEPDRTGPPLAAGMRALDSSRLVIAADFADPAHPGNAMLIRRGAIPARTEPELVDVLHTAPTRMVLRPHMLIV
jgi:DNA processing protein